MAIDTDADAMMSGDGWYTAANVSIGHSGLECYTLSLSNSWKANNMLFMVLDGHTCYKGERRLLVRNLLVIPIGWMAGRQQTRCPG